ncbi:MAG: helix-hairpin-helix domain-containing protein [Bacteroidia bacterium]|nr:helix-hairpin-helix domain-containing protein [Bacteroidia bacterium]
MKKEIKYFFHTFFYFNSNEKKGLLSLLILVLFSHAISYGVGYFLLRETPVKLSAEKIAWIADTSQEKYENKSAFYPQKNQSSKLNYFYQKQDSVKKIVKVNIKYPLDINTADSIQLIALPKIGPYLAGKIVEYRKKLGSYHSLDQLTEIWSFKEDFLYDLSGKIWVNPSSFKPIYINSVGFDELKTHPYFKFTLSKAIINYRTQHGNYKKIEDLKELKIVNDSILRLIKPYLVFD